jgi:hypothetical protein
MQRCYLFVTSLYCALLLIIQNDHHALLSAMASEYILDILLVLAQVADTTTLSVTYLFAQLLAVMHYTLPQWRESLHFMSL